MLILGIIRLALAATGVGVTLARGVRPAVALLTFVLGVVVLGIGVLTTGQGRWTGSDLRTPNPLRAALAATYPSTIALAVLTGASLAVRPQLAAFLAGLLAGLGLVALAVAGQIKWGRR